MFQPEKKTGTYTTTICYLAGSINEITDKPNATADSWIVQRVHGYNCDLAWIDVTTSIQTRIEPITKDAIKQVITNLLIEEIGNSRIQVLVGRIVGVISDDVIIDCCKTGKSLQPEESSLHPCQYS